MISHESSLPNELVYSVQLPNWEGPLDLLLHLIQKHELDILNIPMAFITEKYLVYLDLMRSLNLDVASEYLVMAATLLHLKSKGLLPEAPNEEEPLEEDEATTRENLIKRLLEYQKYKQAAAELNARGVFGTDVFVRGTKEELGERPEKSHLAQISVFALIDAFSRVLEANRVQLSHEVMPDRLSLSEKMNELFESFKESPRKKFVDLLDGLATRFDLVITFLALLEMTKLGLFQLYQSDIHSDLHIELTEYAGSRQQHDFSSFDSASPQDPFTN